MYTNKREPMDQAEIRYTNFKAFIKEALPETHKDHSFILLLNNIPLSLFLREIKSKANENEKHVLGDLLKKMDLTFYDIDTTKIDKLFQYIAYFKDIASL